jgi:Uma2 family endonuclease
MSASKPAISPEEFILAADALGIRLEMVAGVPLWEASPVALHQFELDRIRASIGPEFFHASSSLFRFPDGSLKRPDIAILCATPSREEMKSALRQVPQAVVEIISVGYEEKDLRFAPGFYLQQGVQDILIFNPETLEVWHHRKNGVKGYLSPHQFVLECGCMVLV